MAAHLLPFMGLSLCRCTHDFSSSSYNTNHIGLGPHPDTLILFNHLFNNDIWLGALEEQEFYLLHLGLPESSIVPSTQYSNESQPNELKCISLFIELSCWKLKQDWIKNSGETWENILMMVLGHVCTFAALELRWFSMWLSTWSHQVDLKCMTVFRDFLPTTNVMSFHCSWRAFVLETVVNWTVMVSHFQTARGR